MQVAKRNLSFLLVASILLFVMNYIAIRTNLYWTTAWADVVSHTLGGMVLGGVGIFLYQVKTGLKLRHVVISMFCIGVFWEIFEVYTGMTVHTDVGYWVDTLGDIFFDMCGLYLAMSILIKNKF